MLAIRKLLDKFGFNWLFLFGVVVMYIIGFVLNPGWGLEVGQYFLKIFFKNILPVLIIVYFLIFIFNVLIERKFLQKILQETSYFAKLLGSAIGGILSSGPVYLWYPLLKQLKEKGLSQGHIATFIYARAIKIPLIPMMIVFFGLKYTIIFNLVLFVLALIIGVLIDFLWNIPETKLKNKQN